MARPRKPNSKLSVAGIGLTPDEDKILLKLVKKEDISIKQLVRMLIRKWMSDKQTEYKRAQSFDK